MGSHLSKIDTTNTNHLKEKEKKFIIEKPIEE